MTYSADLAGNESPLRVARRQGEGVAVGVVAEPHPQTNRARYARYERLLAGWTTRHRPDLARLLTGFTSPINTDLCSDPQSTNGT